MAKSDHGKKPIAAGVGESKRFNAPAAFEPVRELHVGGVPLSELGEAAALIPYDNTDEGIAEKLQKPQAVASVVRDELDGRILERRDARASDMEPWAVPDPMKELAERYVRPGMRPKFLSPSKVQREGTRGFEVVKDERSEPVKLGNMLLAQMPEEKAIARTRHYQQLGLSKQAEMKNEFTEQQERLLRDAGMRPGLLRDRGPDGEGLRSVRGNLSELEGGL